MSGKGERADLLLVRCGACTGREEAKRLILAGMVRVGPDRVVRKPSECFPLETQFDVEERSPYVSRGAFKLQPALRAHSPDLTGKVVLDIGASTGGFTDLALHAGARKVYAIDVGHGQLHQRLRSDPRVISMEGVNARYLQPTDLPEKASLLLMDVSFISVTLILPAVNVLLESDALGFVLVKPQFEASRGLVGKGGVVKDLTIQRECVEKVKSFCEKTLGWTTVEVIPSPLLGPKGNQEYVVVVRKEGSCRL